MQRRKRQVSGFSDTKCHLDRLEVTHFTDEHDVRVLAKCGTQGRAERMCVGGDFTLVDDAILMVMKKLDRVLDGQDVIVTVDVDLVDHRCERCRFTRTGRAGDQYQAARLFAEVGNDRRQSEVVKCFDLVRDRTKHSTDGTSLIIHWDGQEWSVVDNPHPGNHGVLYGVSAIATDDVWAVGNSYFDGLQQSVVEHWDGQEWSVIASANVGPFLNTFLNIWATSTTDIWAVGYHLAVFGFSEVYQTSMIHWDGEEWTVSPTPDQNQLNNYLWDVVGLSGSDAWAVGFFDTGTELQTMIQHWDGGDWTIVPSPNGDGGYISELNAVARVTPSDVWAAGQAFDGFDVFQTFTQQYSCGVVLPPPMVASVAPTSGPFAGDTSLAIVGTGFVTGAGVTIGGADATGVVVDDTSITAVSPPLEPGSLNAVVVTNPDTQSGTLAAAFFADFLDVAQDDPFHGFIETLIRSGVTAGCGGGGYCRDTAVTRAQMAVFLLKSEHGSAFVPPPCAGVFPDVACPSTFADWIEQLAAEGITGGCGGGNYCPDNPVTRQQMAVFLLKAKYGSSYVPAGCTGIFADVACPSQFADWIEELANQGITGGCGGGNYCPTNPNTRGQMAVFLVKTFGLLLYGP